MRAKQVDAVARGARSIVGSIVLAGMAVALTGCAKSPSAANAAPAMGPMPVSVTPVEQKDVSLTGEWVGTLDGYVNAQIQPQVSGYLIRQLYKEGAPVAKGQVLFQIDPRPFQAALEQAQGQVGQAQGQLGQAQAQLGLYQINVNRDTPLAEQHAIAQSQLDNDKQQVLQAQSGVRQAQSQIAAAQAAVVSAKLNLGFTQVRSLISGVAGQATTQVGNLVSPQSVLTSVSQLNPIKAYFALSDNEYLALTNEAKAGTGKGDLLSHSSALPLSMTLANGTTFPSTGHVVFVDRQVNQQTGAIRVAAAFANPGNVLRPGQFARVRANTQMVRGALLVPQVAVQELQGIEQVYLAGPDNKVHMVNVQLGPQYGNDWIVKSGVQPGDRVIVDNLQKLKDGAPVNPHPAPAPTEPTASTNPDATGR